VLSHTPGLLVLALAEDCVPSVECQPHANRVAGSRRHRGDPNHYLKAQFHFKTLFLQTSASII